MSLTVAILGRPNVGKSTLFNRLAGKRLAIVDGTPGVTRDRRLAPGRVGDLDIEIIDTAGFEDVHDDSLEARMREQTDRAVEDADVALFLIDARAGITPLDNHFANWIRTRDIPVILVANKCEGKAGEPGLYESYSLGLGDPLPFSAEHGEGMADLFQALLPFAEQAGDTTEEFDPELEIDEDDDEEFTGPIHLSLRLKNITRRLEWFLCPSAK